MRDLSKLKLKLEVEGNDAASSRIRSISGEVKHLGQEGQKAARGLGAARQGVQSISRELQNFRNAVAGFFAFEQMRRAGALLISYADNWKLLEARIKAVTATQAELAGAMEGLFEISQKTRSSLDANATLYVRLAQGTRDLGMSQERLLGVIDAVNKAMLVSGVASTEARAGLLQFAQAMASGRMQGDEFRSVMENLPGLAQMIAEGLDVTISQLREMSAQGELTTEAIVSAIEREKSKMDELVQDIPLTVGQSWQVLTNAIARYVGEANKAYDVTGKIARAIAGAGEHFEDAADFVKKYGAAILGLTSLLRILHKKKKK